MAVRTFTDPDGREWNVWSVMPSRKSDLFLPQTMTEGWLCFETGDEKRRLHPISEGWEAAPSEDLWSLCLTAQAVPRREPRASVLAPEGAPAVAASDAAPPAAEPV